MSGYLGVGRQENTSSRRIMNGMNGINLIVNLFEDLDYGLWLWKD